MVDTFSLVDAASLGDLKVFLGRSARIGCESVRLIGDSAVLAAYVAVLSPRGLLDAAPTILGLRTFALSERTPFDLTVSVRALLDRLAAHSLTADHGPGPMVVPLPPTDMPVAWTGVTPPRGGWSREGEVSADRLIDAAAAGAADITAALPESPGEAVMHRVRTEVWGRDIPDVAIPIPAGVAFGADSLGFLKRGDVASLHQSGRWTRLTTLRGHILCRAGVTTD